MDKSASHLKTHNNCDHEQRYGTRESCPFLFPENPLKLSGVLVLQCNVRLTELNNSVASRRSCDEQPGHSLADPITNIPIALLQDTITAGHAVEGVEDVDPARLKDVLQSLQYPS